MTSELASKSIRLGNCIIDLVSIYTLSLAIILVTKSYFNDTSILLSVFICYYFLLEGIFGQTIGKHITKTRIVYLKKKNRWFWLLMRTLLRLNPFNQISFLFGLDIGTHDQLSFTRVETCE
jgi:hypothetical protein